MPKEIERKFLVSSDGWRHGADQGSIMRQAVILAEDDRSLRIRVMDDKEARLTLKIDGNGISRHEFEYPIPIDEARDLLELANGSTIIKTRYRTPYRGFVWEIDVYEGRFEGLVVAEVEMRSEQDSPDLPPWLGVELTDDRRFSNRAMADGSLGADWRSIVQDKVEAVAGR